MPETATVHVNGEPREAAGRSVTELVVDLGLPEDGRGVAVAIAGEVVPRGTWSARSLVAGEHVEVLVAMQGG
ncbi:sulfur carrier protein ThiS [Patulibacter sp.]|uniref:sulfur carrier protein ThiS n=1 Tax=Patulibacter sp. TaxID=1912859 RepID=UPI00271B2D0A|nr:sulfur carrier protein ThiS [Patulibacter sp.]MDO9407598.1 sulfur carrier protein ThiS [Patulibacter sp.]